MGLLDLLPLKRHPRWMPIFTAREWSAFRATLDEALRRRGGAEPAWEAEGRHVTVGDAQYGTENLAKACRVMPRGAWAEFMRRHVDAVSTAHEASEAALAGFDAARRLLRARIYPADYVDPSKCPVRALSPLQPEFLDVGGHRVVMLQGESFFTSSWAACLTADDEGPLGMLVGLPSRHVLLMHRVVDAARALELLPRLGAMTAQAHDEQPGSISPHVHYLRGGRLLPISIRFEGKRAAIGGPVDGLVELKALADAASAG